MTKKEFKDAMHRGLGRCVYAVGQNPDKYRDIVLSACRKNIAYDAQSEGTRSWYMYTLANAYQDKEPFILAAAEALQKYRPNRGWDLLHLSELLMYFSCDGHEIARQALEDKYKEFLADMYARKRRPNGIFHILSDLEQLGLVLAVDRDSTLSIARDFGRLYREKPYMADGDFSWFYESKVKQHQKALERAAKKDEYIACLLQREQAWLNRFKENRLPQRTRLPDDNTPEDYSLLETILRERIAARDWDGVHAAGLDAFRAFGKGSGMPRPKHLLPLIYEYTPCSYCRENALMCMSRHRMLTTGILEECLYDSNKDIRRYAAKQHHIRETRQFVK